MADANSDIKVVEAHGVDTFRMLLGTPSLLRNFATNKISVQTPRRRCWLV